MELRLVRTASIKKHQVFITVVKQLVITTGDSLTALNAFGTVTAALQKWLLSLVCVQNFTVIPELKGEVTKNQTSSNCFCPLGGSRNLFYTPLSCCLWERLPPATYATYFCSLPTSWGNIYLLNALRSQARHTTVSFYCLMFSVSTIQWLLRLFRLKTSG